MICHIIPDSHVDRKNNPIPQDSLGETEPHPRVRLGMVMAVVLGWCPITGVIDSRCGCYRCHHTETQQR